MMILLLITKHLPCVLSHKVYLIYDRLIAFISMCVPSESWFTLFTSVPFWLTWLGHFHTVHLQNVYTFSEAFWHSYEPAQNFCHH
jgi:hypothetical protein